MPAEAGIQCSLNQEFLWTPVFTGVTTFYNFINAIGSLVAAVVTTGKRLIAVGSETRLQYPKSR